MDSRKTEKAWLLWAMLTDSAQELWDANEDEFVKRCQQDLSIPDPTDHDTQPFDHDIPF